MLDLHAQKRFFPKRRSRSRNIERRTSNIQRPTGQVDGRRASFGVRRWVLNVGCSMFSEEDPRGLRRFCATDGPRAVPARNAPEKKQSLGSRADAPDGGPSVSLYLGHDPEATIAGEDFTTSEPTPRDSLSPQRGEGRGEGCDNLRRSHGAARSQLDREGPREEVRGARCEAQFLPRPSPLLRLLTPALSSIEEERERGLGAMLDRAGLPRSICSGREGANPSPLFPAWGL